MPRPNSYAYAYAMPACLLAGWLACLRACMLAELRFPSMLDPFDSLIGVISSIWSQRWLIFMCLQMLLLRLPERAAVSVYDDARTNIKSRTDDIEHL
eukprot:6978777-Pyramimonas_sp.AAC.1